MKNHLSKKHVIEIPDEKSRSLLGDERFDKLAFLNSYFKNFGGIDDGLLKGSTSSPHISLFLYLILDSVLIETRPAKKPKKTQKKLHISNQYCTRWVR